MKIIEDFVIFKGSILNSAASEDDISRLKKKLNGHGVELEYIYRKFNGENYSGSPSLIWFENYSISETFELLESMEMIYEDVEDIEGYLEGTYPMRQFYPFMRHTSFKTDIGPIYSEGSPYNGCVIEYYAEGGEFRVWSKSLKSFIEAFFSFSVSIYDPDKDYMTGDGQYVLSEKSINHFRQWPDMIFPVENFEFIDEQELIGK